MQFKSVFISLLATVSIVHAVAIPSPIVVPSQAELSLCVEEAAAILIVLLATTRLQDVGFSFVVFGVCAACYTQAFSSVIISQAVFQDPGAPAAFAASVANCHP